MREKQSKPKKDMKKLKFYVTEIILKVEFIFRPQKIKMYHILMNF